MEKNLTKRQYLGVGYIHTFKDNETGKLVNIPCTEEEYKSLQDNQSVENNPKRDGLTWVCSYGGTIKVDTEDTLLGVDEYCDFKDGYFVQATDQSGVLRGGILKKSDVVDNKIEQSKIDNIWQYQ